MSDNGLFCHAHVIPMHHPQDVTSTQDIAQQNLAFLIPPQAPQEALAATAAQLQACTRP